MFQLVQGLQIDTGTGHVYFRDNFRGYHKALGNGTHADVLHGRRDEILLRRREVHLLTTGRRRNYNTSLREPLSVP